MITSNELLTLSSQYQKSPYHLEKMYLQTLALQSIYQQYDFTFKGGTALMMLLHLPRFSEDLDFTAPNAQYIPLEDIINTIRMGFRNFGIFSKIDHKVESEIGKSFRISAQGPLFQSEKSRCFLKVEISLREDVILPKEQRYHNPLFPDILPFSITFMNPSEILAEKIRAIMTRHRSRDIFDLWFLLVKKIEVNWDLVDHKLKYYNKTWDLSEFLDRLNYPKKKWDRTIQPIVWQQVPSISHISQEIAALLPKRE